MKMITDIPETLEEIMVSKGKKHMDLASKEWLLSIRSWRGESLLMKILKDVDQ